MPHFFLDLSKMNPPKNAAKILFPFPLPFSKRFIRFVKYPFPVSSVTKTFLFFGHHTLQYNEC